MKCSICHQEICVNEEILIIVGAIYIGPTNDDIDYCMDADNDSAVIHQKCLQIQKSKNQSVKIIEENNDTGESIVERSDALSLLGL